MQLRSALILLFLLFFGVALSGYRWPIKVVGQDLVEMQPYDEISTDFSAPLTCDVLSDRMSLQLKYWKQMYESLALLMSDYGHVSGVWYRTLNSQVGQPKVIADGRFLPMLRSSEAGFLTLDRWDFVSEEIRNDYITMVEMLPECFAAENFEALDEEEKSLFYQMEGFIELSYELDSTVSSFIGQMSALTQQWYDEYSQLEGSEVTFTTGQFQPIFKASADFSESAFLIEGNKQYLFGVFEQLQKRVEKQLPPLQNLDNPSK